MRGKAVLGSEGLEAHGTDLRRWHGKMVRLKVLASVATVRRHLATERAPHLTLTGRLAVAARHGVEVTSLADYYLLRAFVLLLVAVVLAVLIIVVVLFLQTTVVILGNKS